MILDVTNLSKAKLGIAILGGASKTVLASLLHFKKIYGFKKINLSGRAIKKLPYYAEVKAGLTRNWASFFGRNAVWFGGGRAIGSGALIYNNNKPNR